MYNQALPRLLVTNADNAQKGDVKSIFGLLVQLYCAQDWPGRLPILYEKIPMP
jgi:hypothetical protein